LPSHQKTGLEHVFQALQKMEEKNELQGIGVVQFNESDIARHSIVKQFVTGFNAIQDNNRRQNLVIPKTLLL
jgi:phosphate starvation-inducible protein PhoH